MSKLLVRLVINAAALWVAARFVDGIMLTDSLGGILFVALIFGFVNALIKPVLTFFSIPFIFLTLGLFTVVINAAMLLVTAGLTTNLVVNGFMPALWGSLVISVVSIVLSGILGEEDKKKK